jgi:hypothetical protein
VAVEPVVASTFNTPYLFVRDKHFQSVLVQEVLKAQPVETQFFMWAIQSLLQLVAPEAERGLALKQVVLAAEIRPVEMAADLAEPVASVVLDPTTRVSLHVMAVPVLLIHLVGLQLSMEPVAVAVAT